MKSLFRQLKKEGGWGLSYFLTDGDNEGNPFPNEERFFHLEKYCIENYLLNIPLTAQVINKSEGEISQIIFDLFRLTMITLQDYALGGVPAAEDGGWSK